ncbi:MAG: GGDEF domain-containing protein [Kofleriaceae bacterium]|nr:GGDEF domain-containing protein [Kofleriaceae bacterium]MBP6837649.1 GGDEF domain-containing protein [Kofleriaceae bacterium]MBP9203830.1 GGDEF domain-containing protein [Kofleriaceae bacterium]
MAEWDDDTATDQADLPAGPGLARRDRAYVVVVAGAAVGAMYKLPDHQPALLGRGKRCDVKLDDDGISRSHARIRHDGGALVVEDLGSRNGTQVNGARVDGPTPLRDGDKIQLGRTTILRFTYHDAVDESFQRQMYESSLRDGLTKLFNKRYFLDRLDGELRFARRHQSAVSVLMVDVDHFKQVNDQHGHLVGDQVLAHVAELVQDGVRDEDVVARFGGEELAIILRAIPRADAVLLAERLRGLVASASIRVGDRPLVVTISIGVASFPLSARGPVGDATELIAAADEALYRAKAAGRNRVAE